ncbi:MAG: type II toxin-antitoxin system death-on-curing family toxin [Symplocastrum torsivum CPER-KK1]|uniref:Type II toxin-antitoxin system death-on-curing family toxin n=1 Tax=Symplocastrum torsivum CPER-KK1 TaxID=450513 RepID=A0A951PKS7_9CYAN|nr:type II toxin-antitoxin system death-on-curing family toxin [Symplocastrum torsivum CPER-KK1]
MQNPNFVPVDAVVAIHERLVKRFGGALGLRDKGLLESALSQPQQTFSGELLHSTIHEQAAAYLYHLAKNHAFVDGNKRIALATAITFLQLNGYKLTLSKIETEQMVLDVVESKISKEELFIMFENYIQALKS